MSLRDTIRDKMRQRVSDGTYGPGSRLPRVAELCDEFGCSTATAVYAMRSLAEEGYVTSQQGIGYFAAASLPVTSGDDLASRENAQHEIVATLRAEARRLREIADRLDRTIASSAEEGASE